MMVGHPSVQLTLGCSGCVHDRPHSDLESRECPDAMCAAAMIRAGEPLARA
jgi:hypothetical protein